MADKSQSKLDMKSVIRYKPLYPPDLLKFEVPQLAQAARRFSKDLCLVMRCFIDQPHMENGWRGFLNDPRMNGSFEINEGLRLTRQLFVDITAMGLPVATELLNALPSLYFADLVSAGAIGARTAESQRHRELASSVQFPVGFTNSSSGDISITIDAIQAASTEHHYISATPEGRTAIAWTRGNDDCFVMLQGNHYEFLVSTAVERLKEEQKSAVVIVDCSQDDQAVERQQATVQKVCQHVAAGEQGVGGVVVQSDMGGNERADWEATMLALDDLASAVGKRREMLGASMQ
ncbi:3-deoxy-7-phosphoheptulonate synthase [Pleosporales sp. CAS-2024a]